MATKITGRPKRGAGTAGSGRKLTTEDNLTPEQIAVKAAEEKRQREEAEGIQLLSVVSRVKKKLIAVDAAKAKLKVEQDELGDIFRGAKTQSKDFERGRIMELVNDSRPAERRNVQRNEEVRARFRRLMGLPVGLSDQERELEARLPEVERNGLYWKGVGYTAGVSGEPCDPPAECVHAGHDNRYSEGYSDGQRSLIEAQTATTKAKARPAPAAAAPEETADQRKAREKAEEKAAKEGLGKIDPAKVGEQAAADFAADNPEPAAAAPAGDGFEASAEELAAQSGRQAIQERREGEVEAEAV